MQVAIMAIITGTMFLRTRIEPNSVLNGSMYMSVCFYSVMIMMFNGLTEMTIAVRRAVLGPGRSALGGLSAAVCLHWGFQYHFTHAVQSTRL